MNDPSLKKRELGRTGVDFVRQQLSDGGPLSERFIERLEEGHVWEFYFDGRPVVANVEQFLHGGQFDAQECSIQGEQYVDFLITYLKGEASRMLLFENQLARLDDPFMRNKKDVFEFSGATYFYYPGELDSVNETGVATHLSSASNYPCVTFAIRAPKGVPPPQRGNISVEIANLIAARTEHVLVGGGWPTSDSGCPISRRDVGV